MGLGGITTAPLCPNTASPSAQETWLLVAGALKVCVGGGVVSLAPVLGSGIWQVPPISGPHTAPIPMVSTNEVSGRWDGTET